MLIVGNGGIPDLPLVGVELFHFVGIGLVQSNRATVPARFCVGVASAFQ